VKHYLISLKRNSIALHGLKPHNKSALPYCDSKTHLSLGKRNPVHRRLFERPYIRQFFWLCFNAGLVFPVSQ
jgi:hypothetical protein